MKKEIEEKSWEEFRSSGLLWIVNKFLHTFGWAIVVDINKESGKVENAFPAQVTYTGFSKEVDEIGVSRLKDYIVKYENMDDDSKASILYGVKDDGGIDRIKE